MSRMTKSLVTLILGFGFLSNANATVWVAVPDVSQLQFQTIGDGRVYLRNLNQFDGNALGCCYNYWIDTNTVEGKNIFALILSFGAQGRGLRFGLNDYGTAGVVSGVGPF